MKKVFIFIDSEHKGFLITLADLLEKEHGLGTVIVARDVNVIKLVKKLLPNRNSDIVLSEIYTDVNESNVIKKAKRIEKQYGINISTILADDRALGRGYLTNADKVPGVIRASWQHKRKLVEIVENIQKYEEILKSVKFVIQLWPNKIISMITTKLGSKSLSFVPVKYGDRMFWSDNNYITSDKYIDKIREYLENSELNSIDYQIDNKSDLINKAAKYTYANALKNSFNIFINDTKNWVRGKQKKDSYYYLGWVPSLFRRVSNYNYVLSRSVKPENLDEYKVVFFTLHLEPEIALQYFSPEFSNSMEAIIWISKSLPADYIVVVKEQVNSYGIRSNWYYKQFIQMPNVLLSHPEVHSWDWINKSDIVATITGTVGQEAIHFSKPVLSFGKHQVINHLPTVHYVSNYVETKKSIYNIINHYPTVEDFNCAKNSFVNAQIDLSIDIPKYKYILRSVSLETDIASKALKNLFEEYPDLIGL